MTLFLDGIEAGSVQFLNTEDKNYVKGSEFVDGSLRFIPVEQGQSGKVSVEVRVREDGVWNTGSIKVGGGTVSIADELEIGGAGEWIKTLEVFNQDLSLIPNIQFDETTGTGRIRTPILDEIVIRGVSQPDDSSEVIGTSLVSSATADADSLVSKIYHKVGSVGATADIDYKLRRDSPTGPIFFQQTLPASLMATPGAEFTIDLPGMVEVNTGDTFFATADSASNISLQSDAGGIWYFAVDFHFFGREEILLENLAIANDAGLILANDSSFVMTEFF